MERLRYLWCLLFLVPLLMMLLTTPWTLLSKSFNDGGSGDDPRPSGATPEFRSLPTHVAGGRCRRNGPSQLNIAKALADSETTMGALAQLYGAHGAELRALHEKMRPWCEKTKSCKFCDREVELLYMLVRVWKPKHMFEMAPNRGYSTSVILEAMERNEYGHLDSFDLHNASVQFVENKGRWNFTLANVMDLTAANSSFMKPYDMIFIDALHEEAFSKWYTHDLLSHAVDCDTPVIIHDICAEECGGRESMQVYQYLAFAADVVATWTLAGGMMPTPWAAVKNGGAKLEEIRAAQGIGGNQKNFKCLGQRKSGGIDPSIFFVKVAA